MKKKTPATFGDRLINFHLPDAWHKLEQWQLRYVCYIMTRFDSVTAKTYIFVRLLGITVLRRQEDGWVCSVRNGWKKVRFFVHSWQVQSFLHMLDFIERPGDMPFCLWRIGRFRSVDARLHDVPFKEYVSIENYYQGFLLTRNNSLLRSMAILLYVDRKGRHPRWFNPSEEELLSVFLWIASVKNHFTKCFPYLFRPPEQLEGEAFNMLELVNAEIRALTGGDITKEREVLQMDCWRALTELNEKAREAQELQQRYGCK